MLYLDEVTRTYCTVDCSCELATACHMLPWSSATSLSLTDPLWSQLDQFVVPTMGVRYMYVCVYICMYVCVYVCVCMYVYMCTYMYVCLYIRTYIRTYVYICMYCMYVCMYVCVHMYMHGGVQISYTHTHTHIQSGRSDVRKSFHALMQLSKLPMDQSSWFILT